MNTYVCPERCGTEVWCPTAAPLLFYYALESYPGMIRTGTRYDATAVTSPTAAGVHPIQHQVRGVYNTGILYE